MTSDTIIIIGAGASGLSAAHYLMKEGFDVQILEASDHSGGRVQSIRKDGYILDTGADGNSASYVTYLDIVKDLGLEDAITYIPTVVGTVVEDRVRYMDPSSFLSLLTTSTYSFKAKLAMRNGMKDVAEMMEGVDFKKLYKSAELDDPNVSAVDFGKRHFGEEGTKYLIEPLARMMQATDGNKSSLLDVAVGLSFSDDRIWTFLGGADLLLKAMAERTKISFNSKVESIEETDAGVTVRYRDPAGEIVTTQAAGCIVATLYKDAIRAFPGFADISAELRANLSYMQINKVQIGYDRPTKTKAWAVQVPSCEDDEIFLYFLDHNKAPDRAPPGHSLINVQTDSKCFSSFSHVSDEDLVAMMRRKVERHFPELRGHHDGMYDVKRWQHVGQTNIPGYYRNAAKFIERIDKNSRVQIAGDVFSKTSQEASAARGRDMANRIAGILQR